MPNSQMAHSSLAPEVLMRIFSFVKDNETFADIALTSRQFNALAKEELLRNKYWKYGHDVAPRIIRWSSSPRRTLLTELNIQLVPEFVAPQNVAGLHIFPNLRALTIRNGCITPAVYTSFAGLPRLQRLRLQWCAITVADIAAPPPATPSTVRNLILHDVRPVDSQGNPIYAFDIAGLQAQETALIPPHLLQGLDALSYDGATGGSLVHVYNLLRYAPNLTHLSLAAPPAHYGRGLRQTPVLAMPRLTNFTGPSCIAVGLLPSAARIAELVLTDAITAAQAQHIIADMSPHALRNIELRLTHWDSDVLCEIAGRFPVCKRLKLVYHYWGPSDDFLFGLGVHHLARMPLLHTLLLHARPQDDVHGSKPQIKHHRLSSSDIWDDLQKWEADGRAGLRDVPPPPSAEAMREYLAVWRQYNPCLELISLGDEGRMWTRPFQGRVWSTGA